jgi:hypothetical protein
VIVYCRDHAKYVGLVDLHADGSPEFATRNPRWRRRNSVEMGRPEERNNSWTKLRVTTRPEVRGWCHDCGERWIEVETLLSAFDRGRSSIRA